jgi:hypothetical protein
MGDPVCSTIPCRHAPFMDGHCAVVSCPNNVTKCPHHAITPGVLEWPTVVLPGSTGSGWDR